jgi:hypothetical protein
VVAVSVAFPLLPGEAVPALPEVFAGFPGGGVRVGLAVGTGLAAGPALAGLAAREAASAAAALATSSGCGRDTSLARMAASITIFIAGITAS